MNRKFTIEKLEDDLAYFSKARVAIKGAGRLMGCYDTDDYDFDRCIVKIDRLIAYELEPALKEMKRLEKKRLEREKAQQDWDDMDCDISDIRGY